MKPVLWPCLDESASAYVHKEGWTRVRVLGAVSTEDSFGDHWRDRDRNEAGYSGRDMMK